jgi:hypothetical protein
MKPQNPFDPSRHHLELLEDRSMVKPWIENAHYIRRWPTNAQFVFGVIRDRSTLVGTIIYGEPGRIDLSKSISPLLARNQVTELQRLFLLDEVENNAETWVIARSFELLKIYAPEKICVVSYADPAAQHLGTIYQAANGIYQELPSGTSSFQINREDPEDPKKWMHSRSIIWRFGSANLEHLKFCIGRNFWKREENRKYRYVWFLCNRVDRKKFVVSMKHIAPYPTETIESPKPVLIDVTGVTSKSEDAPVVLAE